MAKDFYHENFKKALIKDGWLITHDPYDIRIGRISFEIDIGAEKLIAAEKGVEKIAVEIKSFVGPSEVNELHKAIGQFIDYFVALSLHDPNRVLFLGIPEEAWNDFFQEIVVQKALEFINAKVIVFNPLNETITTWIK